MRYPFFFVALVSCACLLTGTLEAQTTVTIGTPNSSANSWPFNYPTPGAGRYHVAYGSSEINLTSGAQLLEVQVQITGTVPTTMATYNNFMIRCAHTTLATTALTGTYANNYTGTLTTCLGPSNFQPSTVVAGGLTYARFPLTTAFSYNGTQNLLLDFSQDSRTGTGFTVSSVGTRSRVYINGTGSGASSATGSADTAGNWQVRLIFQTGPGITVTATAGTAQSVLATDTGPSSTGRSVGTFTLAANSSGAVTLNSITLAASGSGNDSNAYSEVGIFDDSTGTTAGTWDAGDTRYGAASTAFPADNGSIVFTASQSFAASQSRTYFVVVKMNGSTLATVGQTFNTQVSALSVTGGSAYGAPSTVMNGVVITAPTLTVAATAGTAQSVLATDTGPGGNGRNIGTFTITNGALGTANLASITLTASGSGNDSSAYTEVGIFEDTNANSTFDFGTDTRYGAAAAAFPADNGSLTFTAAKVFAISATMRYFVVVKLNGGTLATLGQTFNTQVSSIGVSGGTASAGTPSTVMNGLVITAPTLTVSATAGTAQNVYANDTGGGNGLNIGTFTIANGAVGAATLASITLTASGSGADNTAFTEVGIFEDTNNDASFDVAVDTRYGTAATAYPSDNGALTFTASKAIAVSTTVRYFVVVKLNGATPASPGNTFNSQVTAITTSGGASTAGTPSTVMNGLSILAPVFTFADLALPATQGNAYLGGTDFVMQTFTIAYPNGPANTLTGITVQASGTGNDLNDYASVKLYRDSNTSGSYEVGVDTQVASVGAFAADDGQLTFTLSGSESNFATGSTTRYFIVVAFNMNGTNNTTFATQLQGASGQATGTTLSGLPAPAAGATPGLNLLANNLIATLNGPSTATGINNNEQGTGGLGVCICDVTLNTIAAAWTVNSLTFRASGTGNDATAYNYLALHEDSNASGAFDAGDALAVAAAGSAFAADDGDYTATLSNGSFPASTTRRFFLVAKWNGTATTGQNFAARLQSISATPPSGGQITGAPTALAASFTINAAILSVANAPAAPASAVREGGVAFGHSLGLFRFAATNNNVTINAMTLTTTGSGDWAADLTSVELYADNGNGVFDAAIDTLVFSGAGTSGTTVCTLSSAVNVANGANVDIWVRLNVAATAGASVPETFIASIANTTDVNVTGGTVAFGAPAPTTNSLGVVTFFVTTFTPAFDLQTGGAAITITGSGFLSPITCTIGGAVCSGTAVIAAGGTQITGLTVPPGTGTGKTIVLTNGPLGAKTLTQTFDYAGGSIIGGSGRGGRGGGSQCAATDGNASWLAALALLALAATLAMKRRRA